MVDPGWQLLCTCVVPSIFVTVALTRISAPFSRAAAAIELLMPAVQPAELWEESGRWEVFGPQMLKIKDRHQRDFCFGPTHEEVITDVARREIKSYRQLPVNFYQIQMKFRDEIRPRFGVMREIGRAHV